MRILVTGGCGMVGYHAATYFEARGHDVFVVDNLERSDLLNHKVSDARRHHNRDRLLARGIQVYPLDVSEDYIALDPEVIVHLAAQCGVPSSMTNPSRDFQVNAMGTLNILELARRHNSKVVYASSNKVYPIHEGWNLNAHTGRWEWENPEFNKHGFPTTGINMDNGGRTPYGNSKYAGDLMCQEWYKMYGVQTGVFRMSCIAGTHQFSFCEQGWLLWFIIATLKGLEIEIFGDGHQVRDILYVEDLVKAYSAFIFSDHMHGVWNIGGGPNFSLSLNESLDIIEDITGKRSKIIYKDWRPSDQRVYTSDIRTVQTDLSWGPTISPKVTIEKGINWVENNIDVF